MIAPLPLFLLARHSVEEPRLAARFVLNQGLSLVESQLALGLMSVLSTLVAVIAVRVPGLPLEPMVQQAMAQPGMLAVLNFVILNLTSAAIWFGGRLFGGQGDLAGSIILTAWLQAVLLIPQVGQVAAMLLLPSVVPMIALLELVLIGWLISHFTAELHGFAAVWQVFFGLIGGLVVLSFALALVIVAVIGKGV